MACGLVQLVDLLGSQAQNVDLGSPPAWARYQSGHWQTSHDSMFDFRKPIPPGWEFVAELTKRAAAVLARRSTDDRQVIGHSDWHSGNMRFLSDPLGIADLAAVYDMDLFVDTEPVVAGFAAAAHLGRSVGGDTPVPDEIAAFLMDYDAARGRRFTAEQQRQAAAAATLSPTYNGRCGLSVMDTGPDVDPPPWSPLTDLHTYREAYLDVRW